VSLFNRTKKLGEHLGLARGALLWLAWVAGGIVVTRAAAVEVSQHPRLAVAFVIMIGSVVTLGGLVGFWIVTSEIDFGRRGYRVRRLGDDQWVYEERDAHGTLRGLPISREVVGGGYPAPCKVGITSETLWQTQAPQWARGRRADIVARIAECLGAGAGAQVLFVEF
jgi:hypothetical protein